MIFRKSKILIKSHIKNLKSEQLTPNFSFSGMKFNFYKKTMLKYC